MDGLDWTKLDPEMQAELRLAAASRMEGDAEAMYITQNYQPLIDLYNEIDAHNRELVQTNMIMWEEYEQENMGDI